ncbi:hypothetical protein HBI42_133460 [Parastagonospora nodorum]|nr:hypothetical protein HBI71_180480 [Parastagonospora nodorum]KAH5407107.1 hypothetical protein HBI47_173930 [Parastagonospora nodorum]KAH6215484.1 hypothetical protein HBI43_132850 [Parastagonospora nodorum]KAH6254019.1 hypothetical protein HBI42_133460 [Parastagonospora nodorum]
MSRYEWVKSQTNRAVSWLVDTASAHGSVVRTAQDTATIQNITTHTTPTPKQGRLKGKARTEAREKARKAKEAEALRVANEAAKQASEPRQVSTDELLRQGRYLRNLQGTIIMPKYIWRAYKDAIRGRQKYAEKFAAEEPEHQGNAGHVYFLDILRQIVSMLEGRILVQASASTATSKSQDRDFTNLFSQLSIEPAEDAIEQEENHNSEEKDDMASVTVAPVRYEPKVDPAEEAKLLWFCFVDDAVELRNYVIFIWLRFFEGGDTAPSLPVATFLTEAAMAQITMLEKTMKPHSMSEMGKLSKVFQDQQDWTLAAITIMSARAAMNEDPTYPISVPLSLPRLLKLSPQMAVDPIVIEKDTFLIQYLMDLSLESNGSVKVERESSDGVSSLINNKLDIISRLLLSVWTGTYPSVAVFCAATALQHIWESNRGQLRKPMQELERYLNKHQEFAGTLFNEQVSIYRSSTTEELNTLMRFVQVNPVQLDRYRHIREISPEHPKGALCGLHRNMWKDLTLSYEYKEMMMDRIEELEDHPGNSEAIHKYMEKFIIPNPDPNFLRSSNPALCGKLLLNAQMRREEINLNFVNMNQDLHAMCHMYNALRQFGYLDEPWHALETYIDLHIKTIFMGERPTASAQVMVNRVFLSSGLHSEALRQLNNPDKRTKDPRFLAKQKTNRTGNVTLSSFMGILSDYLHDKDTIQRTLYRMDDEMVAQAERELVGFNGPKSRSPIKSYLKDSGPIAFLQALEVQMGQIDRVFATDGIELSRTCTALFEEITLNAEFQLSTLAGRKDDGFSCLAMMLRRFVDADQGVMGAREVAESVAGTAAVVLRGYIQEVNKGVPQ